MLFIATHRHSPDRCLADDPTPVRTMQTNEHLKASGVKVLGSYIAAPEHTFYFVLEADEYAQVVRYLRPILTAGQHDIVPVQSVEDTLRTI